MTLLEKFCANSLLLETINQTEVPGRTLKKIRECTMLNLWISNSYFFHKMLLHNCICKIILVAVLGIAEISLEFACCHSHWSFTSDL